MNYFIAQEILRLPSGSTRQCADQLTGRISPVLEQATGLTEHRKDSRVVMAQAHATAHAKKSADPCRGRRLEMAGSLRPESTLPLTC
jgi:hypothetical protein